MIKWKYSYDGCIETWKHSYKHTSRIGIRKLHLEISRFKRVKGDKSCLTIKYDKEESEQFMYFKKLSSAKKVSELILNG